MKKTKSLLGLFAACFAIILALAVWAGINPPVSVSAASSSGAYSYTIEKYEADYIIGKNRVVSVKERITAKFSGYDAHGIIRDFPLGGGVKYRHLSAECENSGDFSPYFKNDDSNFLSYYLGGKERVSGQTRIYVIKYEMDVPALKEEGYLPLNVLGYGWELSIDEFYATITLPGELNAEPKIYSGYYGTTDNNANAVIEKVEEGKYSVFAEYLYSNGLTVDFSFKEGVLQFKADLSILYAILVGVLFLGAACVLRLIKYRRPLLIKPISFSPPDEMDPFLMGKLIDDKVDKEDYGALFFYLASKGYLHIDMTESEKNPTIYKSQKPLEDDEPQYCKEMYNALFDGRESVKISALSNSFYTTADRMRAQVSIAAGNNYLGKVFPVVILCLLAIVLLGGFAWLYSLLTVSTGYYLWWLSCVGCAVAFLPPALGVNCFTRRRYKWKTVRLVFTVIGLFLLGVLIGLFFCLFTSPAFGWGTSFILALFSAAGGIVAGDCVTPQKEYAEKLGRILGFKQFIEFTERDKIEFMLKENPELYYNILPYAQVLNVTDAWTDKFKGLKLSMPSYCSSTRVDVFDCLVWCAVFRSFNSSISTNMSSRPKGGYGGGIGKGGFGGGGGRGF